MRAKILILVSFPAALFAQPTIAPSTEPVGTNRGEDVRGYNIRNSFELGWRLRTIGGSVDFYRSNVNFGEGLRLLSSSLAVQSKEGHGGLFDQLLLNTQGLGDDPYQSATLRIEKNKLYRYDFGWRLHEYFNPALTVASGLHRMDTRRRFQDHDFTFLPGSAFQFFAGYTRNIQTGPALSTIQLFDSRGDEYPLFHDIRRERNEYRLGMEIRAMGWKLHWMRGWDNFREDPFFDLSAASQGANPFDANRLTGFDRTEPYHGNSPWWRVALFREHQRYAVNGRFTWVDGRRHWVTDEFSLGTNRVGAAQNRQILAFGDGRRPAATGNLNVAFFPHRRVTVSNHTSVHNIRMGGDSFYRQVNNSTLGQNIFSFSDLALFTGANSTDVNVRLPGAGVRAGYTFSNRRVRSVELQEVVGQTPAPNSRVPFEQTNRLHAGNVGVRVPLKLVTLTLDAEVGRHDRPFYPISDRNYQAFGGRLEYKRKNARAAAYARSNYNTNSAGFSNFASRSKQYGVDASWTANEWFSIDAGYGKQDLDTLGFIAFFQDFEGTLGQSRYVSNIHTATLGARVAFKQWADLFAGYSRVQDTGGGGIAPLQVIVAPVAPAFTPLADLPLTYDSPMARLSVRLHRQVRWNLGYQYYRYAERYFVFQNYRAHTGFVSVLWSF